MKYLPVADSVVALRSFPRRFRELIGPPGDDDTWDRLVRVIAPGQLRSPLGWTALAASELQGLGAAISALPTRATVVLLRGHEAVSEVEISVSSESVLRNLTTAATGAAVAAESRSTADWDRKISLDGASVRAGQAIAEVVQAVAGYLRELEKALEAVRR